MNIGQNEVIDLLDDDDDDIGDYHLAKKKDVMDGDNVIECSGADNDNYSTLTMTHNKSLQVKNKIKKKKVPTTVTKSSTTRRRLQTSLVLQDDDPVVDDDTQAMIERHHQQQQEEYTSTTTTVATTKSSRRLRLFDDEFFPTLPSSIRGDNYKTVPKCRCSKLAKLTYNKKNGRPYYTCHNNNKKCQHFSWAYTAEQLQWFRFGAHTGHVLVRPDDRGGFSAQDLCQGRVGDCWFLSALAVVAERPDLIRRLFPEDTNGTGDDSLIKVNLFVDGIWKTVVIDNFLPCMVDDAQQEDQLQQALEASLVAAVATNKNKKKDHPRHNVLTPVSSTSTSSTLVTSSKFDPYAIADSCKETLRNTLEFLEQHQRKTLGNVLSITNNNNTARFRPISSIRTVTSQDLAYSKALHQQLWVPFLEKAYAKSHGCYSAISGGHIAEAFLDLTGAPTLVYKLLNSTDFQPRRFWKLLLDYRRKQLPMGCGTDSSAAGIVGMHAYSILDVVEVSNVPIEFFHETGAAHGNVSGFTEHGDGIVRLLKIRNPHGKGEWKGEFSDRSRIWERLQQYMMTQQPKTTSNNNTILTDRSMKDDGTFWIDYDNFLMGFSNVDVVLAFMGNHGKSFPTNFPMKKSNHRCARAFELSLLDDQPGLPSHDKVEVYVMGIQKTRRGATSGRVDRKKSYKVCDLGMLVGDGEVDENMQFVTTTTTTTTTTSNNNSNNSIINGGEAGGVQGQMFGFRRDGHYHLVLDRSKTRSVVVMPISFGHPAATDKELSFVLRFVSDAPLMIRELPETPRMDMALQKYCLEAPITKGQGIRKVLLQDDPLFRLIQVDCRANGGGVIFLYLCVNEKELQRQHTKKGGDFHNKGDDSGRLSFSVEATCRGMSCRCENGILEHETIAKGKKFEAAWRKFTTEFVAEHQSRLLLVLYQSGQDTEFGSIICKQIIATPTRKLGTSAADATTTTSTKKQATLTAFLDAGTNSHETIESSSDDGYDERGIFNSIPGSIAFEISKHCCEHGGSRTQNIIMDDMLSGDIIVDESSLERALELSRGDYELQQALKLSEQEPSSRSKESTLTYTNDDSDLQRALEMSMVGGSSSATANVASSSGSLTIRSSSSSSYEDDLEKAIRLSMEANQQAKRAEEPVLDLTGDDDDDDDRAAKRLKLLDEKWKPDDDDSIVVAADDDSKPMDLAEKRKLAAEAAMNRLQTK